VIGQVNGLRRLSIAALVSTTASLWSLPAAAQDATPTQPPQTVEELRRQANDAMASLRLADALAGYKRAYELSRDPALLYNMGHALEALEDYPGALAQYLEFQRTAPPDLKARVPRLDDLVTEMRTKVAAVSIHGNVAGARVLLRDKALGVIPSSGQLDVSVNAGPAHLEVVADAYSPFVRDVELPRGGSISIDVQLIPTERAGVLVVNTTPAGGEVTVDGRALGVAPVEASVAAGMHEVLANRAGFHATSSSVVVAVHERKEIVLSLEQTPPLYTRWWFWTGVAVAIAGGVVISYAALTERAPDKGTIAPGVDRVLSLRF
jgi:PEGA domain-containing protein